MFQIPDWAQREGKARQFPEVAKCAFEKMDHNGSSAEGSLNPKKIEDAENLEGRADNPGESSRIQGRFVSVR
jgi:hypothetical protein